MNATIINIIKFYNVKMFYKSLKLNRKIMAAMAVVVVFFGLVLMAPSASATVYVSQGVATSTNLLSASSASSITNFYYNIAVLPATSSVRIQFSKDNTNWYSAAGVLNEYTAISTIGGANLSLTAFATASSWTSGNPFYYKMELNSTTDLTGTPTIEDIRLDYVPASGYEEFVFSNGGNVGIGTITPTNILSLGGTAARTIWMERNITAATAGQGLTVHSGGAIAGTADLAGGNLTLSSGISTGTGSSNIYFNTATAGTTGTTDRTPDTKMTILGNGNVGIGTTTPTSKLDVLQSSASTALAVTQSGTGKIVDLTGDSITTGTGLALSVDGLISGTGVDISSTSIGLTSGKLLSIDWSPTSVTTATGDLLTINVGPNGTIGNLFNVTDNASSLFSVSETAITMNRPMQVNVAGNTGISYDLNFLNTGTTQITSEGPLVISAGDANHSENLTITTASNSATGYSGISTGSSATTLVDSTAPFTASAWIGGTVTIIGGPGAGQVQKITANDTTTITVADWTGTALDVTVANSIYHLAYAKGGDVITNIQNADIVYGGFKVAGMDSGGYVFRISPDGDVEIGGNGSGGSDLTIKQNATLTGGILTVKQLAISEAGTPALTENADQGSADNTGCSDATAYYYKVTALNDNGETTGSTSATITTGAASGTYANDDTITITWTAVSGATKYKIHRSVDDTWNAGADDYWVDKKYVTSPTTHHTDDCQVAGDTASDAPPSANTTGGRIAVNTTVDGTGDRRLETLDTGNPQLRLTQSNNTNYADFEVDANGDLTITTAGSGTDIIVYDDNLQVCASGCPTTGYTISGTGNLLVENKVVADSFERICADGYIWVPGSAKFGTMPGFCVMKYEAKCSSSVSGASCNDTSDTPISQEANAPWRYGVTQEEARVNCQRIGTNYHLISEMEWMTIAENIANTTINDVDSTAELQLATGHSDNVMTYATAAGSHITTDNNAILLVTGTPWTADQFIQYQLLNTTDVSSCYITANTASSATCTLTGGTDNNWDIGDVYKIIGPLPVIAGADPVVSGCVLTSNMEATPDNDYDATCEVRGDAAYSEDADDNGFYGTGQAWNGTYSSGGSNDAQLRTHILSNGNVIWDISGNVYEWTDALSIAQEHPVDATAGSEWLAYAPLDSTIPAITKYNAFSYLRPPNDLWNGEDNGVGRLYSDYDDGTATRAFRRGGNWGGGAYSSVFTLDLSSSPTSTYTNFGFRCAR
ncbi:MAG: hypothetical protein P1P85_05045 [Patescibacteria group bacterium]|nr:hypothetical protein [Patescibacteria group bacterium]